MGLTYCLIINSFMSHYSPINFKAQFTILLLCGPILSFLNGYVAAKIYKFYNGANLVKLCVLVCTLLPCVVIAAISVIDTMQWF